MASWYSKLLTTTTSQISNLQSKILQGENDGDTEDDTHVCRVLRAYYTEEGKPFPGWLPPDPKAPPPAAPVYSQQQPAIGSRYGGLGQQQQTGVSPGPTTGLSSLWDNSGSGRAGSAPQQPVSLRQNQYSRGGGRGDVQSRPLPSQRAGSYQQNSAYGRDSGNTPPPTGSSTSSAQDKLKQRLWGGAGARTTSPSSGSSGPFQPPRQGGGGGGGYSSGSRGGGGGDDYESRFAPGGMYDGSSSRGGGGGGGDRPFMGANAPWSSGQDDFSGGGRPSRTGLPSGPRRGGLPSGPRMR